MTTTETTPGPMVSAIDEIMGADDGTAQMYLTESALRAKAREVDAELARLREALQEIADCYKDGVMIRQMARTALANREKEA